MDGSAREGSVPLLSGSSTYYSGGRSFLISGDQVPLSENKPYARFDNDPNIRNQNRPAPMNPSQSFFLRQQPQSKGDSIRESLEFNQDYESDVRMASARTNDPAARYDYNGPQFGQSAPSQPNDGHMQHSAYFINTLTLIHLVVFGFEIYYNGGFESIKLNPLLGPSADTLLDLGAKYGPYMRSPNHDYFRFVAPIFLHGGVVHILMNFSFQIRIARQIEQEYGTWRVIIIYFVAGVGGNLASCLFVPNQVQVGASGSLYGMMGCLIVDLVHNWDFLIKHKVNPWWELFKLLLQIIISLSIGLLPIIDNFAHVGGFIFGSLAGLILLPTVNKEGRKCCGIFRSFLLAVLLIGLLLIGFYIFFSGFDSDEWCSFCQEINCLDALFDCSSFE